jgi:hypothetical protein
MFINPFGKNEIVYTFDICDECANKHYLTSKEGVRKIFNGICYVCRKESALSSTIDFIFNENHEKLLKKLKDDLKIIN